MVIRSRLLGTSVDHKPSICPLDIYNVYSMFSRASVSWYSLVFLVLTFNLATLMLLPAS